MEKESAEKTKGADFGKFPPPTECRKCGGRGETKDQYVSSFFSSGYWTYKKCVECMGTGKNKRICIHCKEFLSSHNFMNWCSNQNCKRFGFCTPLFTEK